MHLLPLSLGKLADLADDVTKKFNLAAVRLRVKPNNTFIAEATDTKVLLQLSGPCVAPPEDFPDGVPGFDAAPNGHVESLVPAAAWKKAFASARKVAGRAFPHSQRALAVKIGQKVTTLAATDGAKHQCETVGHAEGKFPPTDDILKKYAKADPVRATFAVDPYRLADLLKTIAETTCNEEDKRVEFEVRRPDRAITIKATNRTTGVEATAIIMPLTDGYDPRNNQSGEGEAAQPSADVIALEKKLGVVTSERGAPQEERDNLMEEWMNRGDQRERLKEEVARLKELLAAREDRIAELTRAQGRDEFARSAPVAAPAPIAAPAARPLTRAERLAAPKGGNS